MTVEKKEVTVIPEYPGYPRKFITYRWYRPILTGVLFFVFYIIFGVLLFAAVALAPGTDFGSVMDLAEGGYDNLDVYTPAGAIINLGSIALMIPALALANLIAGGRTFRSYSSSRGGWDHSIFFKCLLIAFITIGIPIICDEVFYYGRVGESRFTLAGLIALTIFCPLQCIAEEYAFRAILMQTFGSWFRIVPLAIVLSAAVFASAHPYNKIGVAEIFISGCMYGIVVWAGRGIEASSAMHIVNNMAIFYCVGIGFGEISSQVDMRDLVLSAIIDACYVVAILICRKRGMFDKISKDDAAEWNAKAEAKRARKAVQTATESTARVIVEDGVVVIEEVKEQDGR